ncbi:phage tail family protein (plasmid) [Levilactobacillus brevis]|uniref:distal tail protein Dit n=1 Tax=Levilactobacillus brevis TaxID=1580 RepID=UPI002279AF63|nr:distal tail protein Dit [Levilactobacillus brevis]WAE46410.1 phage tail family protein [Levilactobacillus brevis]
MVFSRTAMVDTFDYAFSEDGSDGFNSFKDLEILVNHVSKPIAPTITESFQDVPGRYGGVFLGNSYGEKEIDIPITIMAISRDEYNRKMDNLSKALINTHDDADTQYPLRFNDQPEVVYYGHFTAIPTPTFISEGVQDCTTTLTFMLADPRGFLPQRDIKITSNEQVISPAGNTAVQPVVHIIPKTDLYYFGYTLGDQYVAVGYHVDDGSTVTDADGNVTSLTPHQELQVHDPCNSMSTWFQAGTDTQAIKVYRGENDGKATATASALMVAKDSKGHYNWGTVGKHKDFYGPVIIHQGIPKISNYWKVSMRFHHIKRMKNERAMGKVEGYLLDSNNNVCGRMGITDYAQGRYPRGYIQLGSSFNATTDKGNYLTLLYNEGGRKVNGWNNHDVRVHLTKTVKVKTTSKAKSKAKSARLYQATLQRESFKSAARKKTRRKRKKKATKKVTKRKSGGKRKSTKVSKPTVKTKSKTIKTYIMETSYMNSDAYSNFFGEFSLERQKKTIGGKVYDNWVAEINEFNPKTGVAYSVNTEGKVHIHTEKLDKSGKFGFALANVAATFMKHDIKEDLVSPKVGYYSDFETLTDLKIYTSDGSDDPDDIPHVIAHAGEEIIIDSADNTVTVAGRNADKYVSWLSTFPPIEGDISQEMHFTPDPANADITLEYKPAIK